MNKFFELSFGISSEVLTHASSVESVTLKLQTGRSSCFMAHRPTEPMAHLCHVCLCPCLYLTRLRSPGGGGWIRFMCLGIPRT